MSSASEHPTTFRRLAVAIGWIDASASASAQRYAGRRLRQYVASRANATRGGAGAPAVLRAGVALRSPYVSTLVALRRACPELFDRESNLEATLRRELGAMRDALDTLAVRVASLEHRGGQLPDAIGRWDH